MHSQWVRNNHLNNQANMEGAPNASFSLHFKPNKILGFLVDVPKYQENILLECFTKYFESSRIVEVHSHYVVLSCTSTRFGVDLFTNKSPLSKRLEILAVLSCILQDLSKLGWHLTNQSIHGNYSSVERRSTIYFRYSPGPTKHFSCLVENGISRRLLLRKSQTSDELITNLNVALFTAYPKFKKDFVTSSSFQMTKAEEDQHIDYNEFLDSSNTKLKHPCQFLTTAVDFLQLVGFEFPVALSLFGDSMVVVLFSMPTGQLPNLEIRLTSNESHVFNLIIQPTKMKSIVCENAKPEIRKALTRCFYKNRKWKLSAHLWSPPSVQGRQVLLHLLREFGLLGWKPVLTLDGLGYPYTVIIFTQFMTRPSDGSLSSIFQPQKMAAISSLTSQMLKVRAEFHKPPENAQRVLQKVDCLQPVKESDFKGDLSFTGPQFIQGFISMLKIFSAFTNDGWTILASVGASPRDSGPGTNQLWLVCKTDGLLCNKLRVAPINAQPPPYSCGPLEPPPPYSFEDPLLQPSAPVMDIVGIGAS